MQCDFVEAVVSLLPADAGGRRLPVYPREGSYRPFARTPFGEQLRLRFIEGPPLLAPGDDGIVVVELETDADVRAGLQLELLEYERLVGILDVMRRWR